MVRKLVLACGSVVLALAVAALPVVADEEPDGQASDEKSQDTAPSDEPKAEKEYVEVNVSYVPTSNTIASKLPLPVQLTPANVGTVSETLFHEQDGYTLTDALRNVSGLNVQAQGGVHDFFMIRGYDSISSSLVLTDGAVEPEATWYPLYNVAGIEVLKGPSGFLYGIDPLAGVVNIVRKQPVPANFANFGLSVGSFSTVEATLDWNRASADGNRNFRLNGLVFDTDNYRDVGGNRQLALNPSYTWQLSDDSTLNFNFEYVDAEFSPDSGLPLVNNEIPDVPRDRSYQTPFDFSDQQIYRFQIDYETRLSDKVRLRNKFYYRDMDWNTQGTQFIGVFPSFTSGSLEVSRLITSLDDRQQFAGNQIETVFELGSGSITHNLLAGVEVKYLTDEFDIGVLPPEDPFNPQVPGVSSIDLFDPVETAVDIPPFPFLGGDSESFVVAPYVTDQMTISQKFQVLLGARYDIISRDDQRTLFNPPTQEDVSRNDTEISPMVGLVYAPNAALSLYANASQSYAPAGVRVFGDLEPEESTGYEAGAKKKFLGDKVHTTLALYELKRKNLPIPDDTGVIQQAGDQRSRGVELEIAAEPMPRLRAFLTYAYTDAELTEFAERVIVGFDPVTGQPIQATVDRTGNTPAFVPDNLLNIWISKSFRGGLGIGGGARYIDEQYISEDNAAQIDDALIFDATVFYDFKKTRLSVNLKNLTDKEYEVRGFGSTSVIPAHPFSVYLGFGYRM
jgi:outer membrane receptor protein involved in Fe transport